MNTFLKVFLTQRLQFCVYFILDVQILDTAGAEKLLGKGDMLFLAPGQNNINRLQAPWISDEDVSKLIKFIKEQSSVKYDNNFIAELYL